MFTVFVALALGVALGEIASAASIALGYSIPPSVRPLRLFTLIMHLISAVCMALIVRNALVGEQDDPLHIDTLVYATLYVLAQFLVRWSFALHSLYDFLLRWWRRGQ